MLDFPSTARALCTNPLCESADSCAFPGRLCSHGLPGVRSEHPRSDGPGNAARHGGRGGYAMNHDIMAFVREIKSAGYRVERGRHFKVFDGPRLVTVVSVSPADARVAIQQARHQIKRARQRGLI